MTALACGTWTILVAGAPAAADSRTSVPTSLRMRSSLAPGPDEAPAPTPAVNATPNLSEEALARLAAQAAREPRFTVTGSLIERTTFTTPAPLTILRREDLDASDRSTLGDILSQLPAQGNAGDAQANNTGDGWPHADLRGLGSTRTLTLLDGRRLVAGATGAAGAVDASAVPLAAIERVEILKDGASAVYGSDAIGGVVNIITRNNFEGTEASLYTAAAQHGDGFLYDASFITGHHAKNKQGNIILSAGIQSQDPVFTDDRLFSKYGGADHPLVTPHDLSSSLVNSHTPPSRYSLYSAGSYELRPGISGFFDASYVNSTRDQLAQSSSSGLPEIRLSRDSVYNPFGGDVLGYTRGLDLALLQSRQSIGTFRTVAGLQGAVPEDAPALKRWTWEVSYEYGRSDGTDEDTGGLSASRLANALGPSFLDTNGVPTCGTQAAPIAGCVPINLLGPSGSIDPKARSYVALTGTSSRFNEQQTVLALAHGRIATLPNHGHLSAAVGADLREEAAGFSPADSIGVAPLTTEGTYVFEGFGELSLVPISGQKLAEWVELDLAARGFRYDSSGSGIAWNAGGLFRMTNGFAIRGTYVSAFHAPSAGELLGDRNEGLTTSRDPCDTAGGTIVLPPTTAAQCAKQMVPSDATFGTNQQRTVGGGNSHLAAETARIITAGVVFEPPKAKGLSFTADYWSIDITRGIQPLTASTVLSNCYTANIQSYCDQIHRNPNLGGAIDHIDDPLANVGGAATSGLDIAEAYDHKLGELGRLHERFEAQYLFEHNLDSSIQMLRGPGYNDVGLFPALTAILSSVWQHPSGVGAGIDLSYVDGYTQCFQGDCHSGGSQTVEAMYQLDLFGRYTLGRSAGATTLTVGVNNLLDRKLSLVANGFAGTSAYSSVANDGYAGRFLYTRLSHRF